jgi:uncharacterized protein (TIGR02145 family)
LRKKPVTSLILFSLILTLFSSINPFNPSISSNAKKLTKIEKSVKSITTPFLSKKTFTIQTKKTYYIPLIINDKNKTSKKKVKVKWTYNKSNIKVYKKKKLKLNTLVNLKIKAGKKQKTTSIKIKAGKKSKKIKFKLKKKAKKAKLKKITSNLPSTLTNGKTFQTKLSITKLVPKKKITFKSSNPNVVKVNNLGLLTAVNYGTVNIKIGIGKIVLNKTVNVPKPKPIQPTPTDKCTVNFYSETDKVFDSTTTDCDKTINSPTDKPTKTGYTFKYWTTNTDTNAPFDFENTPIITDTDLYAKWKINTYTVNFYSKTDTLFDSTKTDYNTLVESPTDKPTKTGHTFKYWHLTNTDIPFDFKNTKIITNTDLYASYSDIYNTVSFNTLSGIPNIKSQSIKYNEKAQRPQIKPYRQGKTFTDWYLTLTYGSKLYDFDTSVTDNITLLASYSDVYQVTVINGTGSGEYEAGVTVNITAYEKDGYTFSDWTSTDETVIFANSQSDTTTFTMPSNNITVSANYNTYTIHYDLNGGTGTPPPDQTVIVGSPFTSADIPSNVTKGTSQKDVYWNTQTDGLLQNDILQGSKNNQGAQRGETITLYLQWADKKMQDFTNSDCQKLNTGTDVRLYDIRNNQIYQIRKLADNNCWMVNNLSLSDVPLTKEDTNTVSDWTLPPQAITGQSTPNDIQVWGPITPSDYNNPNHNSDHFGGNLYNYQAATGNINDTTQGDSAPYDICPKNWKMPTNTDFTNMLSKGGGYSYVQPTGPFAGVFSGLYYNSFFLQFSDGYYWSSTVSNGDTAYDLYFYSSLALVGVDSKNYGLAVRCLANQKYTATVINGQGGGNYEPGATVNIKADPAPTGQTFTDWTSTDNSVVFANSQSDTTTFTMPNNDVEVRANYIIIPQTMQEMSKKYCDYKMTIGESKTLTDIRNNQDYTIRKLADNNCWMVNNLSLSDTVLTPGDTNTVSDWVLPPQATSGSSSNNPYVYGPIPSGYDNIDHNSDHFGGNLYNYQAATGNASATSGNAPNDICPINWRMPTSNDMNNLPGVSASSSSYLTPTDKFAGVFSGNYFSSLYDQYSKGYYWSSTVYNGINVYFLYFNSSNVGMDMNFKDYGFAVRCLVK